MNRKILSAITIFIAITLILSIDIEVANASELFNYKNYPVDMTEKETNLTDFQIKFSEYLSKGDASELKRIREYMSRHNEINKDIDKANPPLSPVTKRSVNQLDSAENERYLGTIEDYSEPTVNPYTYQTIGFIDHPEYAVGDGPDSYSTHLQATDWYQKQEYPYGYVGGEAIAWGEMSDLCDQRNEVHVVAKRGQTNYDCPPWYNYLVIGVSMNGYEWDYPIYCEIQSGDFYDITVGSTDIPFNYLSIFTWCPTEWTPLEKSSFYIDSVSVIETPIPTWLYIDARDGVYDGALLYPDIYVDGNYAGTGYVYMEIDLGWHTIYVDDPTWSQYRYCYASLSYFSDYIDNGGYRYIEDDYFVTAWYI